MKLPGAGWGRADKAGRSQGLTQLTPFLPGLKHLDGRLVDYDCRALGETLIHSFIHSAPHQKSLASAPCPTCTGHLEPSPCPHQAGRQTWSTVSLERWARCLLLSWSHPTRAVTVLRSPAPAPPPDQNSLQRIETESGSTPAVVSAPAHNRCLRNFSLVTEWDGRGRASGQPPRLVAPAGALSPGFPSRSPAPCPARTSSRRPAPSTFLPRQAFPAPGLRCSPGGRRSAPAPWPAPR